MSPRVRVLAFLGHHLWRRLRCSNDMASIMRCLASVAASAPRALALEYTPHQTHSGLGQPRETSDAPRRFQQIADARWMFQRFTTPHIAPKMSKPLPSHSRILLSVLEMTLCGRVTGGIPPVRA